MHFLATTALLASMAAAFPALQRRDDPGWSININDDDEVCLPNAHCGHEEYSNNDNPDPHQVYKFEQVTSDIHCGDQQGEDDGNGCEMAKTEVAGTSVSVSVGTDFASEGIFSAGFAVTKSWESGQAPNCAGTVGEVVCVYYRTGHTMYGVNAQKFDNCCAKDGDVYRKVVTAPNANEMGSGFICARNEQCQGKGNIYWNNMEAHNGGQTKASGPIRWPFGTKTGLLPEL